MRVDLFALPWYLFPVLFLLALACVDCGIAVFQRTFHGRQG